MDDSFTQMREYIMVTERLMQAEYGQQEELTEVVIEEANVNLAEEMHEVIFKLRAFMESSEGDIGLGIEMGMQRAADMIENVLNRYQGE